MNLWLGLLFGATFGALLQLAGASSHTYITNTLRLKDLTVMKLILLAIGVGLIGIHALDLFGQANLRIKDFYALGIVLAGVIFGIGMALSGYCPGTALAAAAEGKSDAWMTVLGGFVGALGLALIYPAVKEYLLPLGYLGKITLQGGTGIQGIWLALPLGAVFIWIAFRLPLAVGAAGYQK